jgi:hypothetical protein
MTPTIFLIENIVQPTTNIVKRLAEELQQPKYESSTISFPNSFDNDLLCVVDLMGLKIGLMDHNNVTQSPTHLLDFFSNKSCKLIFCTSVNNSELKEHIEELAKNESVKFIHFTRIWSGKLTIEHLKDYQVLKLMEIIALFSDDADLIQERMCDSEVDSGDLMVQ